MSHPARYHRAVQTLAATDAEQWAEVVATINYPLVPTRTSTVFEASVRQSTLTQGVSVAEVSASPNELVRTPSLVRKSPSNDVLLVMQLNGLSTVSMDDRRLQLEPGTATLFDPIVEYAVRAERPVQQLVLTMPRSVLTGLHFPVSEARGRRLDTSVTSLRALAAVAQASVSADDLPVAQADALACSLLELSRATLATAGGSYESLGSREALAERALAYLRANLHDPSLTPERVARVCGVSPRTLARSLYSIGSPAEIIRMERLKRARARLNDPQHARDAIGQTAVACGFVDTTTFTRAYKRAFGRVPSDDRHLA